MTNFEKVKEIMNLEDYFKEFGPSDNPFCNTINKLRQEDYYCDMSCEECYEWLKQEYKEPPKPILTDKEREYLSAVIKPFRKEIINISKRPCTSAYEYIRIKLGTKGPNMTDLPLLNVNTMYKGMELNKKYTLEELGL